MLSSGAADGDRGFLPYGDPSRVPRIIAVATPRKFLKNSSPDGPRADEAKDTDPYQDG
jgi:hypothetical protein